MRIHKEGRRLSAKMRAKLEQAIVQTENSIKIIRTLLAEDLAEDAEEKAAIILREWSRADMYL